MDTYEAQEIAERWSGGRGLVPRGPRMLLGYAPATPTDVERHTGCRSELGEKLWKLEVGGRFLSSGGLVYPGGVPYPEELAHQTALIANEVWLYVEEETGHILGSYWWPDAMRRPIASLPHDEYDPDDAVRAADAANRFDFELRVPSGGDCDVAYVVDSSPDEALLFCTREVLPDPLHEMTLFEQGGMSLRVRAEQSRPPSDDFLRAHQPPYRRVSVSKSPGIGRDPGRSLGPQTWPWPGELSWWENGVSYELKGFQPLASLVETAASLQPVTPA